MTDDPVEYWQQAAARATANYEAIIESQRECIAELQRRCQELLYERTMMRASNAMDFRDFCLSAAAAANAAANVGGGNGNSVVPLDALLSYLHDATDGLVPPPDSRRKRVRPNTSESAALFVASPSAGPVRATSSSSSSSPNLIPAQATSSALPLSDDALQQQQPPPPPLNVNVAFRTGPPLSPRTRALQRALFLSRRRLREGDVLGEVDIAAGDKSSLSSTSAVVPAAGQSFRSAASAATTQQHRHSKQKQDHKKLVS